MTPNDIITKMATDKYVENLIESVSGKKIKNDDTLNDLSQMIYEQLLTKDIDKVQNLWENNEMNFYVTKIITNSLYSTTSRYYYLFKKNNKYQDIDTVNITDNGYED